jgi:lipoyl-dependent peroxiredoxin
LHSIVINKKNSIMETSQSENIAIRKVLYTAKTHATCGREGTAKSSDGRLDIQLTAPGTPGNGTNPEQLFAAGWSACFLSALGGVAKKQNIELAEPLSIDAEVDLGTNTGGFLLQARLNIHMPGVEKDVAQKLVELAHQTCPYSKATSGNIHVQITVV